MKIYRIFYSDSILEDLRVLSAFIASVSSIEHGNRYVDALFDEIDRLVYLADVIADSPYQTVHRYHPNAKRMVTQNKRWTIIFHTQGDYVVVDKIIPAKMITE